MPAYTVSVTTTGTDPKSATLENLEAQINAGFASLAEVANTGDADDLTEGATNKLLTATERSNIAANTAAVAGLASVASSGDADDLTEGTTNKLLTVSERSKLAAIESLADVTDAGNVGAAINAMTATGTPVAADAFPLWVDALGAQRKVTFTNLRNTLLSSTADLSSITPADADTIPIVDDSNSNAPRGVTVANLGAKFQSDFDSRYAQTSALAAVATSGDSDDLTEGAAKLLMTTSERSKLAAIEASADVTDQTNVGSAFNAMTVTGSAVAADTFPFWVDALGGQRKISFTNLRNSLLSSTVDLSSITPADADTIPIVDDSNSDAPRGVTVVNLRNYFKTTFDSLYGTAAQGTLAASALQQADLDAYEDEVDERLADAATEINRINSDVLGGTGSRTNEGITLNGSREHWVASYGDVGNIIEATTAGCTVDMRNLRPGYDGGITVAAVPGGSASVKVFDSFTNSYELSAGDMLKFWRLSTGLVYQVLTGSAPTVNASDSLPVASNSLVLGGQSIAVRFTDGGGAHGLQVGYEDFSGTFRSYCLSDGATGGSGLVPYANATDYWWDPGTTSPGPCATAWKAVLDAHVAAGQATPGIAWFHGQTDAGVMGEDATTGYSAWKTSLEQLLAWMRAQVNPGSPATVPIFLVDLGAKSNNVSPTDAQYSAIRAIYQEIIDGDSYVHNGATWWDIDKEYYDSHINWRGSALLGYRASAAIDNTFYGGTNDLGPYVSAYTELDSGATAKLTITGGATALHKPDNPYGFTFYESGDDPLTGTPVPVERTEWVGNDVYFYFETAVAGRKVLFPSGVMKEAPLGRYIRDLLPTPVNDGLGNCMPLQPIWSGAF